jgi:hypothetical protein
LGAFGKIEWIDPEVLTPPAGSESGDSSAPADTEEQDEDEQRRKLQSGEFQCELLFVVRHLQPVEE